MNQRTIYQKQYQNARINLLVALILTVVNIVMLILGSDSMLLFSISFPYFMVIYAGMFGSAALLAVAAISLIAYFLCWLLSKKRSGWLIAGLVFMILDTLMLAGFYWLAEEVSGILDVLFHIWILFYLFTGLNANRKQRKLPTVPETEVEGMSQQLENSTPIRRIHEDEKCRILLQAAQGSYRVCYRRVKKTNQLVINDYIYDEMELTVEYAHALCAVVNGHRFEVGLDETNRSYIELDGNVIAKKIRWF